MAQVPILEMEGITKEFPGVRALDRVDFQLFQGEVHALLGENGAGKSTMVKILSGSLNKDSGRVILRGREVEIGSPSRARTLGIGMVYQELSLVSSLSVAENIFLGRWPRQRSGTIDWKRLHAMTRTELGKLGLDVDPRIRVGLLSVAEQQLVEIAKVVSQNVYILLLDEPTSALSDRERERLFNLIRSLKSDGMSIIYISHRLAEVLEIADRITVLRDGRKVGTVSVDEAPEDRLVTMMVGRSLSEQFPKTAVPVGAPVLEVKGMTVAGALRGLSFEVRRGEIVGVFGLMGSGRTTLARALFGLERVESGEVYIDGSRARIGSPMDAIRLGIGYLTEDRRQGLVPCMSIPPNVTLSSLRDFSRFSFLKRRLEEETAERFVRDLRIRTPSLKQKVARLSGGNQQKVVLSKWMCRKSKLIIFDEPTRGIDVAAKAEVFQFMNGLAQQGIGVLMISSELPELLGMCDRILVMRGGKFVAEFQASCATQEQLLKTASGIGG
ncbi:MAG: sugar ABC transporter ATP-binding protein [Firmicutes bacterium]|nr:sugar ABC transporter ATP-binding protein [Bacillota bacterium]MDH7494735.1 sugar ABC transporter ATP-binding protein [Bacillota bacterium]